MAGKKGINIQRVSPGSYSYTDRDIYRSKISVEGRFSFRLDYKYSGLLIMCDRDIGNELEGLVRGFYADIEKVIAGRPGFKNSLVPIEVMDHYPPVVKDMCHAGEVFNVGPMASIAGAVCDHLAENIAGKCSFLMIENGGDVYIKSSSPLEVGIFTKNNYFKDMITLLIEAGLTPCGICSSSGSFGHSLSLGKSDLVTVLSGTAILADAAATAVANTINREEDIDAAITRFRKYSEIKGLIAIKNKRIGLWGQLQLAPVQL
ncbi:MAG: UPF0280 family protein [Actinobacteria bacterium]|nr:UPF0280 family protein [Actinomycetota bacterium]